MKKLAIILIAIIFVVSPTTVIAADLKKFSGDQRSLFRNNSINKWNPYGRLIVDSDPCIPGGTVGGTLATSDERASAIAGILQSNGYSNTSIAAILGNLANESGGFYPTTLEKNSQKYPQNANITVDETFRLIDANGNKTYGGGFGIAQWTEKSRVENLQKYADEYGLPVSYLETQVGFLVKELARYGYTPDVLNALDLEHATYEIWKGYERPEDSFYEQNGLTIRYSFEAAQNIGSYTGRLNSALGLLDIDPSDALIDICNPTIGNSAMSGNIAATAIAFAWPQCSGSGSGSLNCASGHKNGKAVKGKHANASYDGPTELYGQNSVGSNTADCAIFVASVIHYAGVDPSFPKGSTADILPYLLNDSKQSDGTWVEVTGLTSTSQVQAGDIIIWRGKSSGHIMIALGGGLMADASLSAKRNGDISKMYSNFYQKDYGNSGHVFRLR